MVYKSILPNALIEYVDTIKHCDLCKVQNFKIGYKYRKSSINYRETLTNIVTVLRNTSKPNNKKLQMLSLFQIINNLVMNRMCFEIQETDIQINLQQQETQDKYGIIEGNIEKYPTLPGLQICIYISRYNNIILQHFDVIGIQ